jgi:hypothetical protein
VETALSGAAGLTTGAAIIVVEKDVHALVAAGREPCTLAGTSERSAELPGAALHVATSAVVHVRSGDTLSFTAQPALARALSQKAAFTGAALLVAVPAMQPIGLQVRALAATERVARRVAATFAINASRSGRASVSTLSAVLAVRLGVDAAPIAQRVAYLAATLTVLTALRRGAFIVALTAVLATRPKIDAAHAIAKIRRGGARTDTLARRATAPQRATLAALAAALQVLR